MTSSKPESNSDFTQLQSLHGLQRAEHLSLSPTVPPAEVAGLRFDKLLGQGAFGQVWLAHDLNTGRQVAVKFYAHRSGVSLDVINREVSHLVSMSTGRHIVQVLNVGWDAEPPFYVMEYLENGSLDELVRTEGSLSIAQSASMLQHIADGLSYAHSKGVLHCDLKPANVMLDHDLGPRLADFGQSRMSTEQTPSLGTLFYMAPEQADLQATPDVAWDVYALGAIGYTMLTGGPPHRSPQIIRSLDQAPSLTERLRRYRDAIRQASAPRLHYQRKGIDKALCRIIDICLQVDPRRRYANVQQVIEALEQRKHNRSRHSLFLVGIVGPILFLLLILLFSARSIQVARQESIQSVQQWSLRSNQFASRLAAQSLESELASLFRLVEQEADRPELRELVQDVGDTAKPLLNQLADGKSRPEVRERLLDLPEQVALTNHLKTRLDQIVAQNDQSKAIFNSVFVNGPQGTNVGSHFADSQETLAQSPVGRNFAYRSYFNGQSSDGSREVPRSEFRPTLATHLSAAFRSSATGKWKIGISTPIWPESTTGEARAPSPAPLGVFVLTINLGNFELLADAESGQQHERFAVLIDGRAGNQQGTLLQHPFLQPLEQGEQLDKRNLIPQIDARLLNRLLETDGIFDYQDPAAKFDGGEDYQGLWIAAAQQVSLPKRLDVSQSTSNGMSDLWVLVQERSESVAAPVAELGNRLQRESYIELAALLSVMSALWFLVARYGKHYADPTPIGTNDPPLRSNGSSVAASSGPQVKS